MLLPHATLPAISTLEGYNSAHATGAPKNQIVEMVSLAFIDHSESLVTVRPPEFGRSHPASAPAVKATAARINTRLVTAADLTMRLTTANAKARRQASDEANVFDRKPIVIDGLSYIPFSREQANLLFNLIARRYEQAATRATSDLPFDPRDAARANDPTAAAALRGRPPYHAPIVEIVLPSCRLKYHPRVGQLRAQAGKERMPAPTPSPLRTTHCAARGQETPTGNRQEKTYMPFRNHSLVNRPSVFPALTAAMAASNSQALAEVPTSGR